MEVEVALFPEAAASVNVFREFFVGIGAAVEAGIHGIPWPNMEMQASVASVRVYGKGQPVNVHVYVLNRDDTQESSVDNDGEILAIATQTVLPSERFDGDWDSLVYDDGLNIKEKMLNFMKMMVTFAEHDVSPDAITCNRIVLLHGPPGTGKTTICHGLAQKLAIRYSHKFQFGIILEVNTHSLFSKWFAESGKMVKRLFDRLNEVAENPEALVFVLIDEVESLATARQSGMNGSDPSDAIRVVNALLTQIDRIRKRHNVIIMATSNLTECIDDAFLSRADLNLFVPPPSESARYTIFKGCIDELVRKGMIIPSYDLLDLPSYLAFDESVRGSFKSTELLFSAVHASENFSGRLLRKLPLLAFVFEHLAVPCQLAEFLRALSKAIEQHKDNQ